MDEISPFSLTKISYLNNNEIHTFSFDPEKYGLKHGKLEDLQVNDINESKKIIEDILSDNSNNQTAINSILLNSAAGIFIANNETDFEISFPGCIDQAREAIKSKKPLEALEKMASISNS